MFIRRLLLSGSLLVAGIWVITAGSVHSSQLPGNGQLRNPEGARPLGNYLLPTIKTYPTRSSTQLARSSEPIHSQPELLGGSRPAGSVPAASFRPSGLTFDSRMVQLRRIDNVWKLVAGMDVIREFGANQYDAREALKAIQFYRMTEQHFVGHGEQRMEYYLSSGQAPRGRMIGQTAFSFYPDQCSVKQFEDGWWVAQYEQRLVRLSSKEEAHQALEVIRKHRFDTLCTIGRPTPTMTYFVRLR